MNDEEKGPEKKGGRYTKAKKKSTAASSSVSNASGSVTQTSSDGAKARFARSGRPVSIIYVICSCSAHLDYLAHRRQELSD